MYDVHNNLSPGNIKNMFKKLSFVHAYCKLDLLLMEIFVLSKAELKI